MVSQQRFLKPWDNRRVDHLDLNSVISYRQEDETTDGLGMGCLETTALIVSAMAAV